MVNPYIHSVFFGVDIPRGLAATGLDQVTLFLHQNGFTPGDVNEPKKSWCSISYPLHAAVEQHLASGKFLGVDWGTKVERDLTKHWGQTFFGESHVA